MDADVLAAAVALERSRRAFALATIVWRRAPSSAQPGSKAIVLADGTVRGWLGGACAEPTMVRAALDSLEDGRSRLLYLGPSDELAAHQALTGIVTVPMACESEGALQVHIEPFIPVPQLIVIGRSPAVHALAVQAHALAWTAVVIDEGGDPETHPLPALVRTSLDLTALDIDGATAIVVATQGHYDDLALEQALRTRAAYIGVIAAEKRASALLELLRDRGCDDAQLARVHAPAGLDLGPIANREIAVAVLADLVARRAAGALQGVPTVAERQEARDPVCGMTVFVDSARHHAVHEGVDYWFCAAGCRRTFAADPAAYAP
jgi:xanthine dehydrogenase accessory factor